MTAAPESPETAGGFYDALAHAGYSRLFFLHIPKTGGTSLISFLDQQFDAGDICQAAHRHELPDLYPDSILSARLVRGHFQYDLAQLIFGTMPPTLTLLREPCARFISDYQHLKRRGTLLKEDTPAVLEVRNLSLEAFVERPDLIARLQFENRMTAMLGGPVPRWPGLDRPGREQLLAAASPVDGQTLPRAIERLAGFPWFGLMEQMEASLLMLCGCFRWRPPPAVPHRNVSPSPRERVPRELLDKVSVYVRQDLALYAEAERLFSARWQDFCRDLANRHAGRKAQPGESPPRDQLAAWLEQDYLAAYAKQSRAQARFIFHPLSALPGVGWHDAEKLADGKVARWTGPGDFADLDLPLSTDKDLELSVDIRAFASENSRAGFHLEANGLPVRTRVIPAASGHISFGRLRAGTHLTALHPVTRLTLHAPASPARTAQDARAIGILVQGLRIQPAGPPHVLLVGDDSALEPCIRTCRDRIPGIQLTAVTGSPAHTTSRCGIAAIPGLDLPSETGREEDRHLLARKTLQALLHKTPADLDPGLRALAAALSSAEALIIAGGNGMNGDQPHRLHEILLLVRACADRRIPVLLTGQTLAPQLAETHLAMTAEILRSADWAGCCDERSLDLALQLGVHPERAALHPDEAFVPAVRTKSGNGSRIAVTISRPGKSGDARGFMRWAAQTLSVLSQPGSSLVYLPCTPEDIEDGALLAEYLPGLNTLDLQDGPTAADTLRTMDLVVSTRYTPILAAMACGVPALGLHEGPASRARLDSAFALGGLSGWNLHRDTLYTGHAAEALEELWNTRDTVSRQVLSAHGPWLERRERHWSGLARTIIAGNPEKENGHA